MKTRCREKYIRMIDKVLSEFILQAKRIDLYVFQLDGISVENAVLQEIRGRWMNDRMKYESYMCEREKGSLEETLTREFRKNLFDSYLPVREPLLEGYVPRIRSYYSCPCYDVLEEYWGQTMVFCKTVQELDYFIPFLRQPEKKVVLLAGCEVPEELEISEQVTVVEFSFLQEAYVFNRYLYHKFQEIYNLVNSFAPLLDILQPTELLLVKDTVDASLLAALSERRSIPVISFQSDHLFSDIWRKSRHVAHTYSRNSTADDDGKIHLFWFACPFSGVGTYSREMLSYFNKNQDVIVYQIYLGCKELKEVEINSVNDSYVIKIPFNISHNNDRVSENQEILNILAPWLKEKAHILFHLNECGCSLLVQEARRLYGVKVVYTLHFLPDYFSYSTFGTPELKIVGGKAVREMVRIADRVICVTDFARQVVVEYYKKDQKCVELIYNGYSDCEFKALSVKDKIELRKKYGFRQDEIILLYVGRIAPSKGIAELLRDFKYLVDKYKTIRLLVVGSGAYDYAMVAQKGIWGHVSWLGEVNAETVRDLYHLADIGVLPSLYEQCSYVALEMLAARLPIVASNAPGMNEIFKFGPAAEIFPLLKGKGVLKIEPGTIASAIEKLIQMPGKVQELTENGYQIWEKYFQRERMGIQTLRLYKSLAGLLKEEHVLNNLFY